MAGTIDMPMFLQRIQTLSVRLLILCGPRSLAGKKRVEADQVAETPMSNESSNCKFYWVFDSIRDREPAPAW